MSMTGSEYFGRNINLFVPVEESAPIASPIAIVSVSGRIECFSCLTIGREDFAPSRWGAF